MYLKSIEGLNLLIKETDEYKNKVKKTDRNLLIDKANLVINNIINKNKNVWNLKEFEPVSLHSSILLKQLGRNYRDIMDMLLNLNIIETDGSYLSKSFTKRKDNTFVYARSKAYGLTEKSKGMKIGKVGVLTRRIEKKIMVYKVSEINKHLKKGVHNKIIDNLKDLTFTLDSLDDALNLVKPKNADELNHYTAVYDELKELNSINSVKELKVSDSFFYNTENKVGRSYHYYTNIPRVYRKHLRHSNGDRLVELDLKSSQPLILALLLKEAINDVKNDSVIVNNKTQKNTSMVRWFEENKTNIISSIAPTVREYRELNSELERLFNKMVKGEFYQSLQDGLNQDDYSQLKVNVLKTIFKTPKKYLSKDEKVIEAEYPYFLKFMRYVKIQRSNKELAHLTQIYESTIFIDKVFGKLGKDVFALPVHDSIITTEKYKDEVQKTIVNSIVETFKLETEIAEKLLNKSYYE
jgi:hypothetical protein